MIFTETLSYKRIQNFFTKRNNSVTYALVKIGALVTVYIEFEFGLNVYYTMLIILQMVLRFYMKVGSGG
ncbi:hypothetical protein F0310_01460 [Borrelia sp. A-FGy1]|uniref:hypothetical protein n=1 Tax=Borrelia sp. A-FGy1 TaxID=2608247 RepID=UPI0015F5F724|nr:hypothetical protein [Borrelia sp. A-FGy1]QMU99093.1 hypothetical protein F0310_01460 [Borrelia sp. A-FGy1]